MKTTLTLTKPYTWDTPRVDVWLNQGVSRP
jgi:hypothetical protein